MDADAVKERLAREVEQRADVLLEISHSIHEHPELCYEEHHAHDLLAGVLEDEGFDVVRGAAGMDTAFIASAGSGDGPTIGIFCEYDALPEIGHACGHNVIGSAGLGAGLAAVELETIRGHERTGHPLGGALGGEVWRRPPPPGPASSSSPALSTSASAGPRRHSERRRAGSRSV